MESIVAFSLALSGQPLLIPNSVQAGSGNLVLTYVVAGTPATLTIYVMGLVAASGDSVVLDAYTGTSGTTRTISLTATYDSFEVLAVWTGGASDVGVSGTAQFTGAGAIFQGTVSLMTGNGSPAGVIAAPIGAIYSKPFGIARLNFLRQNFRLGYQYRLDSRRLTIKTN